MGNSYLRTGLIYNIKISLLASTALHFLCCRFCSKDRVGEWVNKGKFGRGRGREWEWVGELFWVIFPSLQPVWNYGSRGQKLYAVENCCFCDPGRNANSCLQNTTNNKLQSKSEGRFQYFIEKKERNWVTTTYINFSIRNIIWNLGNFLLSKVNWTIYISGRIEKWVVI